jgi:hypothetical protein
MSGDLGSIAPTMTSLVLQSRGWRTELLGGNTPAVSLCRAIGALRPALLALSFNHILDEDACVRDCETVFQASLAGGAMLAIGGRAISADLRRRLRADFFGDTLTHLVTFADGVARRYRPAHTHSASG